MDSANVARFWRLVWLRRREVIIARSLDGPMPTVVPGVPLTIVRIGASEGSIEPAQDLPEFLPHALILERTRRKHTGFLAMTDGRVICASWLGAGRWNLDDVGLSLDLGDTRTYHYDSYTDPTYRGKRVHAAVTADLINFARSRGFRWICGRVLHDNLPQITSLSRVGFSEAGQIVSYRLFGSVLVTMLHTATGGGVFLGLRGALSGEPLKGPYLWCSQGRFRIGLSSAGVGNLL